MSNKYIVTLWQNIFDYDGLTCNFSVEGVFNLFEEAIKFIVNTSKTEVDKQLKENSDWGIMEFSDKTKSIFNEGVNKNNKIVYSYKIKTGDGSGFNSIYNFYEVIEVPQEVVIDRNLFNMNDCKSEVDSFFIKRTFDWIQK